MLKNLCFSGILFFGFWFLVYFVSEVVLWD